MILRPSTRPQPLLRAFVRINNTSQFQQRRCEHTVPLLGTNNFKGIHFEEYGVPGFLTPKTFRQTWLEYQKALCDEVNQEIQGLSKYENKSPLALHESLAHQPQNASLYNAAAMLHFNHFWWESLAAEKVTISDPIAKKIEKDFASIEDLRIEMLNHGAAMFGNGFVWLVKELSDTKETRLRIMCTYNAGSPYPNAHGRAQEDDMATANTTSLAARLSEKGSRLANTQRMTEPQNQVGSMGPYSSNKPQKWPGALYAQPILCLNVWQHMYMHDYGILGKKTYLAAWWERIDWQVVNARYGMDPYVTGRSASPVYRFSSRI